MFIRFKNDGFPSAFLLDRTDSPPSISLEVDRVDTPRGIILDDLHRTDLFVSLEVGCEWDMFVCLKPSQNIRVTFPMEDLQAYTPPAFVIQMPRDGIEIPQFSIVAECR